MIASSGSVTVPAFGVGATHAVIVVYADKSAEELFRYDARRVAIQFPPADGGNGPISTDWDISLAGMTRVVVAIPSEDPVLALVHAHVWTVRSIDGAGEVAVDTNELIVVGFVTMTITQPDRARQEQKVMAGRCGRVFALYGATGRLLMAAGAANVAPSSACEAPEAAARAVLLAGPTIEREGSGLRVRVDSRSVLPAVNDVTGTWRVTTIRTAARKPVSGQPSMIVFTGDGFTTDDGCNQQDGNMVAGRGRIVFLPNVRSTAVACPKPPLPPLDNSWWLFQPRCDEPFIRCSRFMRRIHRTIR